MSTGRDGTIIVVQTQGVTPEDDRRKKKIVRFIYLFPNQKYGAFFEIYFVIKLKAPNKFLSNRMG
jgi:hypothetical protein